MLAEGTTDGTVNGIKPFLIDQTTGAVLVKSISAASSVLPTNAATESTLATIKPAIDSSTAATNIVKLAVDLCTSAVNSFKASLLGALPASLGAKPSAGSLAVVLATDAAVILSPTYTAYTVPFTIVMGAQSITVACISGTVTLSGGGVLQAGMSCTFAAGYPYKLAALVISAGSDYTVSVLR